MLKGEWAAAKVTAIVPVMPGNGAEQFAPPDTGGHDQNFVNVANRPQRLQESLIIKCLRSKNNNHNQFNPWGTAFARAD